MEVIRNRAVVPDPWRPELAPREHTPTEDLAPGDVIVGLARWLADREALLARGTGVGVRLEPDDDLEALAGCGLHALRLVEVHFPGFAEGRGYSQARLLRSRHDFRGDVRAVGDVSRDRLAFMERCGCNAFVLPAAQSPADALAAFDEVSAAYQPAADARDVVARLRGWRGAAVPSAA